MDVAILSKDSLKLKIKKTTIIVNPRSEITKTEADAIVSTDKKYDSNRVSDYRVIIDGVGEYEVSGLKIIASGVEDSLMYNFISEASETLLASASILAKTPADKLKECAIVIINVDTDLPQNTITSIEPRIIVLYGDKAKEAAASLGKEGLVSSSKASFSEDKLPEETEIYLLS